MNILLIKFHKTSKYPVAFQREKEKERYVRSTTPNIFAPERYKRVQRPVYQLISFNYIIFMLETSSKIPYLNKLI